MFGRIGCLKLTRTKDDAVNSNQTLTDEQIEAFIDRGVLVLEDAIDVETVDAWIGAFCERSGVNLANPATWPAPYTQTATRYGTTQDVPVGELAPRLWAAMCDLVGGEERFSEAATMKDRFVANFSNGADQPWRTPILEARGGHIDGDYNHFIDSPEAALFCVILWTDVTERGGATYIAPDSIGHALRQLLANPQGLSAKQLRSTHNVSDQCRDVRAAAGKRGTAYLMHPKMVHAASQNHAGTPRLITNIIPPLRSPMKFSTAGGHVLSPVERCTLRQLGVTLLDYQPPAEHLRCATDHDTGELLPWKYGEKPSYKSGTAPVV